MKEPIIVNGTAHASMGLCIEIAAKLPVCEYLRQVSSDADASTWETKRVGSPDVHRVTYTRQAVMLDRGNKLDLSPATLGRIASRVAAYRLAMLVYRAEVDAVLRDAGIEAR